LNGELVVASPVYKQHFSLLTGRCIEDPSVSVPVYRAQVEGADIQILNQGESPCLT
jgi:nitrite reductase (NADH) small subunit